MCCSRMGRYYGRIRELSVYLRARSTRFSNLGFFLRWSRRANSTIEIPDDLNMPLKQIKRRDGSVSDLFPASVGRLFTYDGMQRYLISRFEEDMLTTPKRLNSLGF